MIQSRLEDGAAALGLPLSSRQSEQLLEYMALLARWNLTYNLIADHGEDAILHLHVLDCLAAVPPLRRQLAGRTAASLLDVGSGSGLPGLVVAIAHPDVDVTCVDRVGKKTAFVQQAASVLGLPNLRALNGRVEALSPSPFDVVTCRAFSSLQAMVEVTAHLISPSGVWMAMKGKPPTEELAALPVGVEVFHVEPLQVPGLEASRCLVWLRPKTP